jgi:cell wall assembly regulator SMI1
VRALGQKKRVMLLILAIALIALIALVISLPALLRRGLLGMAMMNAPTPEQMYPKAPPMPPPVATPISEMLGRFEKLLAQRAPSVLASLQPGLSDAEIDALESKHGFKLTPDLRALYRWRNGSVSGTTLAAFPDHHFISLPDAVAERDIVIQQVKQQTPEQQKMYAAFAGYREKWLGIVVDAAGDGYFFDPERAEADGSFFFHFAEDAAYDFFPAFRNYLAGVLEGHESGIFTFGQFGAQTADFEKAQDIWNRHSASPPR